MKYDPSTDPDPDAWQEMDEGDRIELVLQYHRAFDHRMPNANLHAAIHVAVENQIALGDEIPVKATLDRLMQEGLDRHDAVHAIGGVLATHMQNIMNAGSVDADPNEPYYGELSALSAEEWLAEWE